MPPDPGYAGTLWGLHLYTWALIAFVSAVLVAGVMLFLTPELEAFETTNSAPGLRKAAACTLGVLAFIALANLVACFVLQGPHWQLPGY
ncbi:hypothetical protein [Streptomyces roseolus]|uniref:hypothetical protein n=1 Tax=Streptomyces roseolus TaxID=67358 RepID=UPI00366634A4